MWWLTIFVMKIVWAFDITYGLFDKGLGFTEANSLQITMTLTNTIKGSQSFDILQKNTFLYALQQTETDIHAGLNIDQMNAQWQQVNGNEARISERLTITLPFAATGTGIKPKCAHILPDRSLCPCH